MNYLLYILITLPIFSIIFFISYFGYIFFYKKSGYIWFLSYLKFKKEQKQLVHKPDQAKHVLFIFVDHFEPYNEKATKSQAWERMKHWSYEYPKLVQNHRDADDRCPQHTWFYPCEQDLSFLSDLSNLCFRGFGEVEVHLHHHNDTSERLQNKLERAKRDFSKRGASITAEQTPKQHFAFIHGNWALDNSHPKGMWCGVNDELSILQKCGCFADFTLPSAPQPTQTKKINSIYYAKEEPHKPKSHNDGIDARVGTRNRNDFLLIQGPLVLTWNQTNHRFIPSIENGDICDTNPPSISRIDEWINANIHIKGRPEWIFVKVHTHGANPRNWKSLFGEEMQKMFTYLETKYNDGKNYKLHYITAREAYNIIKAAEDGKDGDPGIYRDYILPPYANTRIKSNVLFELVSYSKTWLEIKNCQPHLRAIIFVKKGQLEKIEGYFSQFKLIRLLDKRRIILSVTGKRQLHFTIRTSHPIRSIENGAQIQVRKLHGFFITTIKSYLKDNQLQEIIVKW
ncbi:hypothetical protein JW964_08785 [candidate division KSB1 bacterium]|nr:hypothetical protein [candidate division KSB1 bacterium]